LPLHSRDRSHDRFANTNCMESQKCGPCHVICKQFLLYLQIWHIQNNKQQIPGTMCIKVGKIHINFNEKTNNPLKPYIFLNPKQFWLKLEKYKLISSKWNNHNWSLSAYILWNSSSFIHSKYYITLWCETVCFNIAVCNFLNWKDSVNNILRCYVLQVPLSARLQSHVKMEKTSINADPINALILMSVLDPFLAEILLRLPLSTN
jgi:hypothetical protein